MSDLANELVLESLGNCCSSGRVPDLDVAPSVVGLELDRDPVGHRPDWVQHLFGDIQAVVALGR